MNKKILGLLALSLLLPLSSSPIANAEDSASIGAKDKSHVQVNVEDKGIPSDARDLAKKDYLSYVTSLDKIYNKEKASYTLGEPFKIYKFNKKSDGNYYFPVLDTEGNVNYIVTISPKATTASNSPSKYSINVSPFLSEALNKYKNKQITILTNSKGYYVLTQNNKATQVLKTPRVDDEKLKESKKIPATDNLTHLKQKVSVTKPTTQFKNNASTYNEQYVNKLKNFKIRETQGNNGWCAGYTMSALLNATYNTDKYYAEAVMRYLHPNLQGQDFQFTGLTPNEMIHFGESQGRAPQLANRMTSYKEVDDLTKNNKGIAVLGKRVESRNGLHAGHAMAVVGNAKLDNGQEVIIIWNPWDNGFMTQDAKNNIIPVSNGDHYQWYSSIYGY
ncbi:cysteine protease staphopain [Staphylococcus aureus]|uniref:cysteine protease staphopain n=1 Tax=Staphylococcus aureus TaxID=1280 RepID=UPI0021CF3BD8|nr:cysteine protease staphopain [Staphylococcus aureus]UXT71734.1 cysteine protease staphopain [Staphylococcus aureus]UXT95749.1 cysteine protease staphopain [Staphylococcus aureus]UXU14050.1 cysteine protease staphopain [Staphylococcus aureus]WOL36279.1 cysteine protease staphopain [Staphylococcus aureus]HDL0564137.1 cysteine protease [Staphylococcus aureus]